MAVAKAALSASSKLADIFKIKQDGTERADSRKRFNMQNSSLGQFLDKDLAKQFDDMLKMLVTQFKNQDPTEPEKTNEMTMNLTMMYQTGQMMKNNKLMERVNSTQQKQMRISAEGLNGKYTQIDSVTVNFQGEPVHIHYTLEDALMGGQLIIMDRYNRTYKKIDLEHYFPGSHVITWDGTNNDGQEMPQGNYYIKIIGQDIEDGTVNIPTRVSGRINEVIFDDNEGIAYRVGNDKIVELDEMRRFNYHGGTPMENTQFINLQNHIEAYAQAEANAKKLIEKRLESKIKETA